MTRSSEITHSIWLALFAIGAAYFGAGFAIATAADTGAATAERLVAMAAQAEIAGDAPTRDAILQNVLKADPNSRPARWQLGQIEVNGQWQPVEAAQKLASADPRQREYTALRNGQGDTPQGQLFLARWCEKNGLNDEARFHWMSVLAVEPNFEEAQKALKVRWFSGQLMTADEIEQTKKDDRRNAGSFRFWSHRASKWQGALQGDLSTRTAALKEVSMLDAPSCIPAMERFTLDLKVGNDLEIVQRRQFSMAFLDALERMANAPAIQSITRHAVSSPLETVRLSAIQKLREMPLQNYVPNLLDGLAMPFETRFSVARSPDGSVQYRHELYRQGPFEDLAVDATHNFVQFDLHGHKYLTFPRRGIFKLDLGPVPKSESELVLDALRRSVQTATLFTGQAVILEQKIATHNAAIARQNDQILPVLVATTERNYGSNPSDWWDWWHDYTEYDNSFVAPVYTYQFYDSSVYYHRPDEHQFRYSCFVRGTLVWTKTGLRAIETIEKSDLVLSKHVETGELAFKPVVSTTVRPPSNIVSLSIGDEQFQATRGHPFWVSGLGWRMAKQLGDGDVLHGVKEPLRLTRLENVEKAETYNLIIADFNTYFVGESGVLVHDNTPVRPSAAFVPGVAKP